MIPCKGQSWCQEEREQPQAGHQEEFLLGKGAQALQVSLEGLDVALGTRRAPGTAGTPRAGRIFQPQRCRKRSCCARRFQRQGRAPLKLSHHELWAQGHSQDMELSPARAEHKLPPFPRTRGEENTKNMKT